MSSVVKLRMVLFGAAVFSVYMLYKGSGHNIVVDLGIFTVVMLIVVIAGYKHMTRCKQCGSWRTYIEDEEQEDLGCLVRICKRCGGSHIIGAS
jgi:hypothetical protein